MLFINAGISSLPGCWLFKWCDDMSLEALSFIRKYVYLRIEVGMWVVVQSGRFECSGIMYTGCMHHIHLYELAIPITDWL